MSLPWNAISRLAAGEMLHHLRFSTRHEYSSSAGGLTVPVVLESVGRKVGLTASIDTGASHCLFERAYAEALRIELERGDRLTFRTANSRFEAYGHDVVLNVMGIAFLSTVYFFADTNIRKNVLGRGGWLDRVRLGIVDYDQQIYLAQYDTD